MLMHTLDRRNRKKLYWNNGKRISKLTRAAYERLEHKNKKQGEEIHALKNQIDKLDGQLDRAKQLLTRRRK